MIGWNIFTLANLTTKKIISRYIGTSHEFTRKIQYQNNYRQKSEHVNKRRNSNCILWEESIWTYSPCSCSPGLRITLVNVHTELFTSHVCTKETICDILSRHNVQRKVQNSVKIIEEHFLSTFCRNFLIRGEI